MAQVTVLLVFFAMLFVPCVLAKHALMGNTAEPADDADFPSYDA